MAGGDSHLDTDGVVQQSAARTARADAPPFLGPGSPEGVAGGVQHGLP